MKKIIISINKTDIFDKISLASAYTGAKSPEEEGLYDRVAIIDADTPLISNFLTEICGIVTERFREFAVAVEQTSQGFEIRLELSGSYDEALTPSVKEDVTGVFVTGILARWFRLTCPSIASSWLQQSCELLDRAFSKLCYRRKPQRQ